MDNKNNHFIQTVISNSNRFLTLCLFIVLTACSSGGDNNGPVPQKPELVQMPGVVGSDETTAVERLAELDLDTTVARENHNAPIGEVVDQDPATGEEIEIGATVSITVSDGISIPDLVGLTESDASQTLTNAALAFSVIYENNSAPIGAVVSQSISAGTNVNPGTTVELVISNGITVPNVVGLSESDARTVLTNLGFSVSSNHIENHAPVNQVFSQAPLPGANLNVNSLITLNVSMGMLVPDTVGMNVAAASTLLESAGFNIVVNEVVNSTQVSGEVFDQSPVGGSQANGVNTVTLSVYISRYEACLNDPSAQSLISSISLADAAQGGRIYDKWWLAVFGGVPAPTIDHPIWSQQMTNMRSGADTWRCKECHGWDYKGVDGIYGDTSDSHYSSLHISL